jgi:hypothetical protein
MLSLFRRKRPSPLEAVRDFVDTMEFINVLLAEESAERETTLGAYRINRNSNTTDSFCLNRLRPARSQRE